MGDAWASPWVATNDGNCGWATVVFAGGGNSGPVVDASESVTEEEGATEARGRRSMKIKKILIYLRKGKIIFREKKKTFVVIPCTSVTVRE